MKSRAGAAGIAWFLAAFFYFYQYALRSAPAVMMPQLAAALVHADPQAKAGHDHHAVLASHR